jgi:hypothetical protein
MIKMKKNKSGKVRLNDSNEWVFYKEDGTSLGLTPNEVNEMRTLFDSVLFRKKDRAEKVVLAGSFNNKIGDI